MDGSDPKTFAKMCNRTNSAKSRHPRPAAGAAAPARATCGRGVFCVRPEGGRGLQGAGWKSDCWAAGVLHEWPTGGRVFRRGWGSALCW